MFSACGYSLWCSSCVCDRLVGPNPLFLRPKGLKSDSETDERQIFLHASNSTLAMRCCSLAARSDTSFNGDSEVGRSEPRERYTFASTIASELLGPGRLVRYLTARSRTIKRTLLLTPTEKSTSIRHLSLYSTHYLFFPQVHKREKRHGQDEGLDPLLPRSRP